MATSNNSYPVLVHPFQSNIPGSCCYELGSTGAQNALVFIGGLTDGPQTTQFLRQLQKSFSTVHEPTYSIFEVRLRSAYNGFGTSSIPNDAEDVSHVVKYLRSIGRRKIVLMGHSTGCQDCMEYTHYDKHQGERVDGFVLLAPVSDRESLDIILPDYAKSLAVAKRWVQEGRGQECLPKDVVPSMLQCAVTAYRLHSLMAKGGDDDFFSSDLDADVVERVWSRFEQPVMVLHCELDEMVPAHVDQGVLNRRYRQINKAVSDLSGIVPGAGHTVAQEPAREWLADRLVQFLKTI